MSTKGSPVHPPQITWLLGEPLFLDGSYQVDKLPIWFLVVVYRVPFSAWFKGKSKGPPQTLITCLDAYPNGFASKTNQRNWTGFRFSANGPKGTNFLGKNRRNNIELVTNLKKPGKQQQQATQTQGLIFFHGPDAPLPRGYLRGLVLLDDLLRAAWRFLAAEPSEARLARPEAAGALGRKVALGSPE